MHPTPGTSKELKHEWQGPLTLVHTWAARVLSTALCPPNPTLNLSQGEPRTGSCFRVQGAHMAHRADLDTPVVTFHQDLPEPCPSAADSLAQ